ncbi:hypothetical protein ACFZBU_14980 [Embleya sp. NPDC008237]|uniref:hypothetical protein n=1 Tax=Embleya sp. NPDC008237 TaxID=3363978 RepID=UPI0036ECD642
MRSITRFAGAALLGASLALAAPTAGHAAPARTRVDPADCAKAVAAAAKAQLQYDAAVADFAKAAAGRPDKSRQEQLDRTRNEMSAATSAAAKACPDVKIPAGESGSDKGRADAAQAAHGGAAGSDGKYAQPPSGSMHTGAGGTSGTAGGSGIALGVGLFAAGAGVVVLRRRRGTDRV